MLPALEIGSVIDIHRTTVALGPHQHDPASGGRLQGRSCDRKRVQRVCSPRPVNVMRGHSPGISLLLSLAVREQAGALPPRPPPPLAWRAASGRSAVRAR